MANTVLRQRCIPMDLWGLNTDAPCFNARASTEAIISSPALQPQPTRYRLAQPQKYVSAISAVLGDLCVTKEQPHRPIR